MSKRENREMVWKTLKSFSAHCHQTGACLAAVERAALEFTTVRMYKLNIDYGVNSTVNFNLFWQIYLDSLIHPILRILKTAAEAGQESLVQCSDWNIHACFISTAICSGCLKFLLCSCSCDKSHVKSALPRIYLKSASL